MKPRTWEKLRRTRLRGLAAMGAVCTIPGEGHPEQARVAAHGRRAARNAALAAAMMLPPGRLPGGAGDAPHDVATRKERLDTSPAPPPGKGTG